MPVPVSLVDARRQLRVEVDDDSRDEELQGFIDDAAAWVEKYTGHILAAREVTETFIGFGKLELSAWPIAPSAVPVVTYEIAADQPIIVAPVRLHRSRRPARVAPAIDGHWPSVAAGTAVSVTIRAGYEDDDTVPGNLRRAMLVLIGGFEDGGDALDKAIATAHTLCCQHRRKIL